MQIPQNDPVRSFRLHQTEYEQAAIDTLRSGRYILDKQVEKFEQEFAVYIGAKHCIGLANGLDALWLTFRILGIGVGDEVITQGNTFIASVMGITMNGATPVFVEPDEYHNIDADKLEALVTPKTKAVLAVHLYGQASNMRKIQDVCRRHNLYLVEDCAQSHGAKFDGQMTGTFGDVSCFSFYPTKNLGAFGDNGAVVVNDDEFNRKFRTFRNYGSQKRYYNEVVGTNSRLDELQAALLIVKLRHLDELTAERTNISRMYLEGITNPLIELPRIRDKAVTVWHQFVIRCKMRAKLIDYLKISGIDTLIHYPIPPHLQACYQSLNIPKGSLPITEQLADEVLSLPLFNGMTDDEVRYVIEKLNQFDGYI